MSGTRSVRIASSGERPSGGPLLHCVGTLLFLLPIHASSAFAGDPLHEACQANETAIRTAIVTFVREQESAGRNVQSREGRSDREKRLDGLYLHLHDRETVYCDLESLQWRHERTDLRNVTTLLDQAGLPESERINVCRDASILYRDCVSASLEKTKYNLAILRTPRSPARTYRFDAPLHPGCISPRFFESDGFRVGPVSETELDGIPVQRLVVTTSGEHPRSMVFFADPKIGYRYRRAEHRQPDGSLLTEHIATDYRVVDGIPYPFDFVERHWAKGVQVEQTHVIVEQARFNVSLEGQLQIDLPPGTTVQDTVGMTRKRKLQEGETMTTEQLGKIAASSRPSP